MLKRLIDIVASGSGLLVLAPLLLAIAVGVRITLGKPILFRQMRPGLDGKPFQMVKFRTMRDATDRYGRLLPDSERLTPFGTWLRRTSLDELPELWNVLVGDMSLVGPRPLLMAYLDRYSPEQNRRHEVRPGVTGWAQVNGRNAISWEDKFRFDTWYVDHRSTWLDLRIIILTVRSVFSGDGVNAVGEATMPEFIGNETTNSKSQR